MEYNNPPIQYEALNEVNEAEELMFFSGVDIPQDEPRNMNKKFPFEDYSNEKYFDVLFPNSTDKKNSTNNMMPIEEDDDNDTMLDKLTNSIDNYNSILINELSSKFPSKFEENLKLAENTLPGNIIQLMVNHGGPISFEHMLSNLEGKMDKFRKANGAKYSGDAKNSILSTLKTSNIFFKTNNNLYYFKQKEAYEFIYRNYEREMKKKIKSKKESLNVSKRSNGSSRSRVKKNEDIKCNLAHKIQKIDYILQQMIKKYRGDTRYEKLQKLMNKKGNSSLQVLKEWCKKDKFIGMMMCLKYSKNLIETYIKYVGRKKNIDIFFDLQNINQKIFKICDKIDEWELNLEKNENFPFNEKNNNTTSQKGPWIFSDENEEENFLSGFNLFGLDNLFLNDEELTNSFNKG